MTDASIRFPAPPWRPGSPARRRAAIVAGSVVLHLVLLTPLVLGVSRPPPVLLNDDPLIYLQLEPRPLITGVTPRQPRVVATPDAAPAWGPVSPDRPIRQNPPSAETPSRPSPRVAATAPSDPPAAPDDAWRVTPETTRAAIARTLRTGPAGCRLMDGRLSASEQRLCDDRFNEAAARAGPLGPRSLTPSEQRRDAQLARDGAAALAAHDSLRGGRAGVGITGASPDCPGGNLRGNCAGDLLRPGFEMTDERLRNNRKME